MSYRRGGTRYRNPYRRKRNYRRRYRYRTRRTNVRRQIPRMISPEYKTSDLDNNSLSIPNTWNLNLVNGLARGNDWNQRIGRQVTFKSVQINFKVQYTQGESAPQTENVRLIVFLTKTIDGTAPVGTDVVNNDNVIADRNLDNRRQYVILKDYKFSLTSLGREAFNLTYYKRLSLKTQYNNGDTGLVGDIDYGAIYFMFISDQTAISGFQPTILWSSRVRFIDI